MWSTSAGGQLMKVVNLTGFTVYEFLCMSNYVCLFVCLFHFVCINVGSYLCEPNFVCLLYETICVTKFMCLICVPKYMSICIGLIVFQMVCI